MTKLTGALSKGGALVLALAMLLLASGAPRAAAQISKGNIYGTLADESGAVVPGATVTLAGSTIGTRTTTSATTGDFRFLNLDPGVYKLTVSLSNFATLTRDVRVTIGENVNVGAGSVTANYDGRAKHQTVIGDRASLGVDTMMVAPVTIGEGAITGAGSVVTRDVAPGKTVVGIPARPIDARRRSRETVEEPRVSGGTERNPQ